MLSSFVWLHKNHSLNPLELENLFFDPAYKYIACNRIVELDRKTPEFNDTLRTTLYSPNLVLHQP